MPEQSSGYAAQRRLIEELLKVYRPLAEPQTLEDLLKRMSIEAELPAALESLQDLANALPDEEAGDELDLNEAIAAIRSIFSALREIQSSGLPPAYGNFTRRLNDYLIADYLREHQTAFYHLASLLGWIRFELSQHPAFKEDAEAPVYDTQQPIAWERLPAFFTEPQSVFKEAGHGWSSKRFAEHHPFLLFHLEGWLNQLKRLGYPPAEAVFENDELYIPLLAIGTGEASADFGFNLSFLPEDGLKAVPKLEGTFETATELKNTASLLLTLLLQISLDLENGFEVGIRPGSVTPDLTQPDMAGQVIAELLATGQNEDRLVLIGDPRGNRLDLRSFSVKTGLRIATGEQMEMMAELKLQEGRIMVLKTSNDGFLNALLPKEGIQGIFDLTIGWSNLQGIYFQGSAGLEIKIPAHIELGPIEILGISLGLRPSPLLNGPPGFDIPLGADVQLLLGPFTAVVQDMGMNAKLSYREEGGDFGPFDFDFDFKPPKGIGLALESPAINGGGYLFFDFEKGEYAGVAELVVKQAVAVKAICIIQTKRPDGSPGFSFLLIITAEFKPIQLGFGFTLNGLGGLIAINRGMDVEALAGGVRSNSINAVMFPDDPVAEAPRIIADLNQFFPVAEDRYTFGLMAIIGWGTPPLITVELGLMIQVPDPVVFAILGVVRVQLPDKIAPVVNLQANFIGAIDFEKREMFFFAALFESRFSTYQVEGQMYFALNWGDAPNFLFTVGGFHPAFKPPPLRGIESVPRRITINLLPTDNPRLTIKAYFAVTSNTAQFGARADFYYEIEGFRVIGYMSIDALFRFSPFKFVADISANMAVMSGGTEITSITLNGSLSGPKPWHLKGNAKFKVVLVTIKVRVNKRFGRFRIQILPARQALPLLLEVLRDTNNWEATLPAAAELQVTLRKLPEEELILHPAGQLTVRQSRLPLGMRFEKIGNERPSDYQAFRFAIEPGGTPAPGRSRSTKDFFAPAEFIRLSDSQRLSRRAFERMDSGQTVQGSEAFASSEQPETYVERAYKFEQLILDDPDFFAEPEEENNRLTEAEQQAFAAGNAVARSANGKRQRLRREESRELVKSKSLLFALADKTRLQPLKLNGKPMRYASEAEAQQALQIIQLTKPYLAHRLQVLPITETQTL